MERKDNYPGVSDAQAELERAIFADLLDGRIHPVLQKALDAHVAKSSGGAEDNAKEKQVAPSPNVDSTPSDGSADQSAPSASSSTPDISPQAVNTPVTLQVADNVADIGSTTASPPHLLTDESHDGAQPWASSPVSKRVESSSTTPNVALPTTSSHNALKRRQSYQEKLVEAKRSKVDENIDPRLRCPAPDTFGPHFLGPDDTNLLPPIDFAAPTQPDSALGASTTSLTTATTVDNVVPAGMAVSVLPPNAVPHSAHVPALPAQNILHPLMLLHYLHPAGHPPPPMPWFPPMGATAFPINFSGPPLLTAHAMSTPALPPAPVPVTRRKPGSEPRAKPSTKAPRISRKDAQARVHTLRPSDRAPLDDSDDEARQKTVDAHRANDARPNDTDRIICLWQDATAEQPCHLPFEGTDALLAHCVERHGVVNAKTSTDQTICRWDGCHVQIIQGSLKRHLTENGSHARRQRDYGKQSADA